MRFSSIKNKFLLFWIFFHAAIIVSFLISLCFNRTILFGTSLLDILPPSSSMHEIQVADSKLANKTGRAVTILAKSDSFEAAKSLAEKLYSQYVDENGRVNSDFFDSLSLYVDSGAISKIESWLHENRFMLLDSDTQEFLKNGGASEIANDALSSVFGAFSFSDLSHLEEDPFLLSERSLRRFLEDGAISSTSMILKDDVLASEKDGEWFVLIRGTLSEEGAALAGKKSTVKNLYETAEEILQHTRNDGAFSGCEFIFSGLPFHSYENSTSAQRQISIISTIALILIVFGFLYIFRSAVPAFVSALAVLFSCGIGFVAVLLFFRGIHVLTFVFGTTLIGTCLDYSIHYFVNWKGNRSCDSGTTVRKHILRGISLGFASTEICFAALFFAPFPLLKQVSVFLFAGLASAYLSVVALYPFLKMPKVRGIKIRFAQKSQEKRISKKSKIVFRSVPVILAVFSAAVIFANRNSLGIKNNIQELYSMSPEMLRNEIVSAKVLNTGSSGCYFIVKADSEENLMQKNEELSDFLKDAISQKRLGNFLSVSQFIPSEKTQRESYEAAENLLPIVSEQYENLGIDESFAFQYEKNYRSLKNHFLHVSDSSLPTTIREAISNLWIGEVDGEFYSCVLPLHINEKETPFFRAYAETHDGIFFVSKVSDISAQLDELSETMLLMLALAFILVIVLLFFCYKPKIVLKIAAIPVLVSLVTMVVLILCKINLSFFPITALVLVFGLGLDYIIYAIEGSEAGKNRESENLTDFAILLSFATTALSFGALVLSTFPPVHMLGLTVFAGLVTAVTGAFCITKH